MFSAAQLTQLSPQLLLSVWALTHWLWQQVSPPAEQLFPQVPQFGSVLGSTQVVLQQMPPLVVQSRQSLPPPAPQTVSFVPGWQTPLASQHPLAQVSELHGGGVVVVVVVTHWQVVVSNVWPAAQPTHCPPQQIWLLAQLVPVGAAVCWQLLVLGLQVSTVQGLPSSHWLSAVQQLGIEFKPQVPPTQVAVLQVAVGQVAAVQHCWQVPLQSTVPLGQVQTPFAQMCPPLPQVAPFWLGSGAVTQVPLLQLTC